MGEIVLSKHNNGTGLIDIEIVKNNRIIRFLRITGDEYDQLKDAVLKDIIKDISEMIKDVSTVESVKKENDRLSPVVDAEKNQRHQYHLRDGR